MVREMTDLFPSSRVERFALCHPDETLIRHQIVPAPHGHVRCIRGPRADRDCFKEARARARTPLQASIFGLGLQVCCNKDWFLFKEPLLIQAEKERHLFSPAVHSTSALLG